MSTDAPTLPSNLPWPKPEDMPPLKRRRLDSVSSPSELVVKLEEPANLEIATILPSSPVRVKPEEKSPSPSVPSRRLVTQSCNFYPLPANCRKINPDTQTFNLDHVRNRNALCAKERGILKGHGLKTTSVLFRDDGMVIEWKSPVAVWSDTLLPPTPKPAKKERPAKSTRSKPPPRRSSSPEVIEIDDPSLQKASPKEQQKQTNDSSSKRKRIPLPGRPGWRPPETVAHATTAITNTPPPPSQTTDVETPQSLAKEKASERPQPLLARRRPLPLPKPRRKAIVTVVPSIQAENSSQEENVASTSSTQPPAEDIATLPSPRVESDFAEVLSSPDAWSAEDLVDLEPLAVDYLQRYIKAFDTDLSTLGVAYAHNATFSLRMPDPSSFPLPQADALLQGPDAIVAELTRNLSTYKFCPVGIVYDVRMYYDVVSLCLAAGGGVLLVVYGEVVDMSGGRREVLGLEMKFVLRRKRGDGANGKEKSRWPLVTVSQQIAIRGIKKKVVEGGLVAGIS
ncbi:hypothetical protein DXG03_001022 [Asterophora parasitica]|uniref:NTF2 domain-containing protein n=1 Tax=Asterophora parasitica TaxID=117018 RepID=A0A9P7G3W8_9AGAR|nr:hypothetical protein DXG03_001022 [Asterophora parasitica]